MSISSQKCIRQRRLCPNVGIAEIPRIRTTSDATEFAKVISMNDKKMPSMQMERTGDASKKSYSSNSVDRMERECCLGRLTQRIVRAPLATIQQPSATEEWLDAAAKTIWQATRVRGSGKVNLLSTRLSMTVPST